ncbi:MAG: hypothetical protein V1915_02300 [Candidatus Bathyarchaeota archaeon]
MVPLGETGPLRLFPEGKLSGACFPRGNPENGVFPQNRAQPRFLVKRATANLIGARALYTSVKTLGVTAPFGTTRLPSGRTLREPHRFRPTGITNDGYAVEVTGLDRGKRVKATGTHSILHPGDPPHRTH